MNGETKIDIKIKIALWLSGVNDVEVSSFYNNYFSDALDIEFHSSVYGIDFCVTIKDVTEKDDLVGGIHLYNASKRFYDDGFEFYCNSNDDRDIEDAYWQSKSMMKRVGYAIFKNIKEL